MSASAMPFEGDSRSGSALPAGVAAFRSDYRLEHVPRFYSGWLHFAVTTTASLSIIAFAISRVVDPSWLELCAVPISFLVANLGEYSGHRGPMHRLRPPFGALYERHTRRHHRFYTHQAMAADSAKDFHMVLFPPVMLLFFMGLLAAPIGAVLFFVASPNVGWLFVATAVSYFLTYEWLHFAYHLPASSLIARLPGMRTLRRLHTTHHDPRYMQRHNFNITFPICDAIFGTYRR